MQNHNISKITKNIESSVKNGDFNLILLFENNNSSFKRFISQIGEQKEIENSEEFIKKLVKTHSPFRIGLIRFEIMFLKNILVKNNTYEFNSEQFFNLIKDICKNNKNKNILLPIDGALTSFYKNIETVLNETVRDIKVNIWSEK